MRVNKRLRFRPLECAPAPVRHFVQKKERTKTIWAVILEIHPFIVLEMSDSKHSAAGQMAGYLFQPERALYRLATSPKGSIVGIETLDDVSVVHPDGSLIREQDKHSVGKKPPLAENRVEMWKTFNIWLHAIDNDEVDINKVEFHLVTNRVITSGFCHRLMKEERSSADIRGLVQSLRAIGKKSSKSVRKFSDLVLAHSDTSLEAMFARVRLTDGTMATAGKNLKESLCHTLIMPEGKEEIILQSLLGWVHDTTIELIRANHPAWLTRESFDERYLLLVTQFLDRRFLNETAAALIQVTDENRSAHRGCLFVKQLLWLGFPEDDEQLVDAIDDLIRSKTERIRLAKVGIAAHADFQSFEGRLISRWKNIFKKNGQPGKEKECQEKGKATLFETLEHREPVAGFETLEYYLTRGAYHYLADGPPANPQLGWHPSFKKKCAEFAGQTV